MKNLTPEGYREIENVFNELGQIHYGDAWTGTELNARRLPSPDEITARRQRETEDYEEQKRTHGGPTLRQAPGKPPGHLIEFNPFADDSLPDPNDEEYLAEREARQRRDEIEHRLIGHLYNGTIPTYLKDQHGEIRDLPSRLWQSNGFWFSLSSNLAKWQTDQQTTYTGSLLVKITDARQFLKTVAIDSATHQDKVVKLRGRGRPSCMPEIAQEMRRRHERGKMLPSMYGEARVLEN